MGDPRGVHIETTMMTEVFETAKTDSRDAVSEQHGETFQQINSGVCLSREGGSSTHASQHGEES